MWLCSGHHRRQTSHGQNAGDQTNYLKRPEEEDEEHHLAATVLSIISPLEGSKRLIVGGLPLLDHHASAPAGH